MANDVTDPNLNRDEHLESNVTGKRVFPYGLGTSIYEAMPAPLIDTAWDYLGFTNPDGNGNYQTWVFRNGGSGGTTVRTLDVTWDANNNVTSITRV